MHIAIIGLPNSTKTTLFNALTKGNLETTAYSSGLLNVHSATVDVPDPRVDRLAAMFQPRKTTYAQVTYSDIAGLDQGVSKGGLSGPLLNVLSQSDALVHVVRAFEDPDIPHSEGRIDPRGDIKIVDDELLISDQILVERRIERLQNQLKRGSDKAIRAVNEAELSLFQRLHAQLEMEVPLRDVDLTPAETRMLRPYGLFTLKPVLLVVNVGDPLARTGDNRAHLADYRHKNTSMVELHGRLEMELAQLHPDEAAEFLPEYGIQEPVLNIVIRMSYALLGLQSFFTVGEDEVRAWTVRVGAAAPEAAGVIHTDLARGFIRAEVIGYSELLAAGSLPAARQRGQLRLEGRDYVVRDGDIMNIRFNV